ncbi:MAG: hypothetical protein FWH10_00355 [Oscillospiraceae bacterium]|nr:hypothetical protein [Oscillospiraceae bacterium]
MYMRNNKYSRYNIDGFPPNYSGQLNEPEITGRGENEKEKDPEETGGNTEKTERTEKSGKREESKKDHSLFGGLFGNKDGNKDGRKGGLLSGLFNKGGVHDKDGGFLSNIELEDLILLAVIFFLLKDGFEDDLIIILAIILFSS